MKKIELIELLHRRGINHAYKKVLSRARKKELEETLYALPRIPRHLSHHQIEMFLRCGYQWHLYYQRNIRIAPNAAIVTGSSFEASTDYNYLEKLKSGADEPLSVLWDVFYEDYRARKSETDWTQGKPDGQSIQDFKALNEKHGFHMVKVWRNQLAPETTPLKIQEKFEIEKNGYGFRGRIDLIAQDEAILGPESKLSPIIRVIDHKTAKKAPGEDSANVSNQLTAYAGALQAIEGEIPYVGLDFAVRPTKRNPARAIRQEAERTQAQIDRWWEHCDQVWNAIHKGIFLKASENMFSGKSPQCNSQWCGYWDICHEEIK